MEIMNVRWVGTYTANYQAMVRMLGDVMGLQVNFEETTTVEFSTTQGDQIQVMAPGDPYLRLLSEEASGPVPLFEVDDVRRARVELQEAGIEIVGEIGRDSRWEWIHFRAPDGHLYELASRSAPV